MQRFRSLALSFLCALSLTPCAVQAQPDDPYFEVQWSLQNTGQDLSTYGLSTGSGVQGMDIGILSGWNVSHGGSEPVIAIFDSGIDFNHPEFQNRTFVNLSELGGITGVDDDGNGYVDDIIGANTTRNNGSVFDPHGHGTQVAGLLAASGNNQVGISGVNWNSKLLIITSDNPTIAEMTKAIRYATEMKRRYDEGTGGANVRVINLGYGERRSCDPSISPTAAVFLEALAEANERDIIVVASAASDSVNHDLQQYADIPATCTASNLVTVTSVNRFAEVSSFSSHSSAFIDLAAPGEELYTTNRSNSYRFVSGTSYSSALVSGVLSIAVSERPELSPAQLKNLLLNRTLPLPWLTDQVRSGGTLRGDLLLNNLPEPRANNLRGDYNGDGRVDAADYTVWRDNLESSLAFQADGNRDGTVNLADYVIWRNNYGSSLPPDCTPVAGDYNRDGSVDAADYTVWRDNLGSTTNLSADGNQDLIVNQADYVVWRNHYGASLPRACMHVIGDYNGDGVVDAADYTVWRDNLTSTISLEADGNGDGIVNQADYVVWRNNYGSTRLVPIAQPETASLALISADPESLIPLTTDSLSTKREDFDLQAWQRGLRSYRDSGWDRPFKALPRVPWARDDTGSERPSYRAPVRESRSFKTSSPHTNSRPQKRPTYSTKLRSRSR